MTTKEQPAGTFELPEPVTMPIGLPGKPTVHIDPYEANQHIPDLRQYLAEKLGIEPEALALNQCYVVADMVTELVEALEKERKKKLADTACLRRSILASRATTGNGQTKNSNDGSTKPATSTPGDLSMSRRTKATRKKRSATES